MRARLAVIPPPAWPQCLKLEQGPETTTATGQNPWPSRTFRLLAPRAFLPVASDERYSADAPDRPGSARLISPSASTREVIESVMVAPLYVSSAASSNRSVRGGTSRGRATAARGAEDQAFHGNQMVEHRLPRSGFIAPRDCGEHTLVVLMRPLRATGRAERLLATLGEQIDQRAEHAGDRAIVRGGPEGRMELGILRESGSAAADLLRLLLQHAFHLLHFVSPRPP